MTDDDFALKGKGLTFDNYVSYYRSVVTDDPRWPDEKPYKCGCGDEHHYPYSDNLIWWSSRLWRRECAFSELLKIANAERAKKKGVVLRPE